MIESISVANIASFGPTLEVIDRLSKLNFIFGSNATGKTTISRVIADEGRFPSCSMVWHGGTKLETMVYNRDFVMHNFDQPDDLRGIFTLGEAQIETESKIKAAKKTLDELMKDIAQCTVTLNGHDGVSGKKGALKKLEDDLADKCWRKKQQYDTAFSVAFQGNIRSKDIFKDKIIKEFHENKALLSDLEYLTDKSKAIFASSPQEVPLLATFNADKLLEDERFSILRKNVIGKENVDIASMIKKLDNGDWVRQGKEYYDKNEKFCPFCQQSTNELFAKNLEEYFDEAFDADNRLIEELITDYQAESERVKQRFTEIFAAQEAFPDAEELKRRMLELRQKQEVLTSKIAQNYQLLLSKRKKQVKLSN